DGDTNLLKNALKMLERQFQPEVQGDPDLEQSLLSTLALLYHDFDDNQKAEEMAWQGLAILQQRPGKETALSAEPLRVLRDILLSEHKYAEAQQLFDSSLPAEIGLPAQNAELLHVRGDVRARNGRWREAVYDFSKLIELEPERHESYFALAPLL